MKKYFILGLLSFISAYGVCDTEVYWKGKILNADINDSKEAQTLYEALDTESQSPEPGVIIKTFKNIDGLLEISCSSKTISRRTSYECTVSINTKKGEISQINKKEADAKVEIGGGAAKTFYDALLFKESFQENVNTFVKTWGTKDYKVSISAFKMNEPMINPYWGSVRIRFPIEE